MVLELITHDFHIHRPKCNCFTKVSIVYFFSAAFVLYKRILKVYSHWRQKCSAEIFFYMFTSSKLHLCLHLHIVYFCIHCYITPRVLLMQAFLHESQLLSYQSPFEFRLPSSRGGRTLLDGACNVRTPSREPYPNRGSRRLDSNPKRGTLKQNFTPKRVDFLSQLILHKAIQ